jgi:hypothetical protein
MSSRAARSEWNPENYGALSGAFEGALRSAPVFSEWTWVALWKGHG